MKKIIIIFLCSIVFFAQAQDESILTSKKGIPILPQAGDWAFGIDARPFTEFFNANSSVGFDFINSNYTFFVKKFVSSNTAYRARVRIGYHNLNDEYYTIQDGQIIPDPTVTVTDVRTTNTMNVTLGFGIEKRKGYGRLQGIYGAEVMVLFGSHNESYTYGNAFSMTNPNPTSHDFGSNIPPILDGRYTYWEDGFSMGAGIRGFIGAEYFFAPKWSVGGELGWGPSFYYIGDGKDKIQSWDPQTNSVKTEVLKNAGETRWGFDSDNLSGAIYFMFHFN